LVQVDFLLLEQLGLVERLQVHWGLQALQGSGVLRILLVLSAWWFVGYWRFFEMPWLLIWWWLWLAVFQVGQ
jgi:hypothetical protein